MLWAIIKKNTNMKNLSLTILINLTFSFFLYSQESDDLFLLIYSNKDILTSCRWGCLNVKLSDTLFLDNDSIMLEKSGLIKKQEKDTSLCHLKEWQIIFDDSTKKVIIYKFNFGKDYNAKKKGSSLFIPYKNQFLSWSIDNSSQLLKIVSIKNQAWSFSVFEIDSSKLLLVKKK